jgi:DNA-binding GntR family transcriptional regulator
MAVFERRSTLSRGTTAEELAAVLREMIMRGEIKPGTLLREEMLSTQFEVSRRTVKEALSKLAHERIVRHYRHKGTQVTKFTAADIQDLYRARKTLEGAAAQAADHISAIQLQRLEHAFENLKSAIAGGDPVDVVARDLEFHQAIIGSIESERIDEFFADIAVEMRYALTVLESAYNESTDRPDETLAEHEAILDAFRRGDAESASNLVYAHAHTYELLLVEAVVAAEA